MADDLNGLVTALTAERKDAYSNPYLGAADAIGQSYKVNPIASPWSNLAAALIGGLSSGAMEGYGNYRAENQLKDAWGGFFGDGTPQAKQAYQELMNDPVKSKYADMYMVDELRNEQDQAAAQAAMKEYMGKKILDAALQPSGYRTVKVNGQEFVVKDDPLERVQSVFGQLQGGQRQTPPQQQAPMQGQRQQQGLQGSNLSVTLPQDSLAFRQQPQIPLGRGESVVSVNPLPPKNPNSVELDMFKRQVEAGKALNSLNQLDATLSKIGSEDLGAVSAAWRQVKALDPNSNAAQLDRELKGAVATILKPLFPGNLSEGERQYMQKVMGDSWGVSTNTLRSIVQSQREKILQGLELANMQAQQSGYSQRIADMPNSFGQNSGIAPQRTLLRPLQPGEKYINLRTGESRK